MATKQLTELPGWVRRVLELWGVLPSVVLDLYNKYADDLELPESWNAEVREAIEAFAASLPISVDGAVVILTTIVAELRSGKPGYSADFPGLG